LSVKFRRNGKNSLTW